MAEDAPKGRVMVYSRVRPPLPREDGDASCVFMDPDARECTISMEDGDAVDRVLAGGDYNPKKTEKKFGFDDVFPPDIEQKEVFNSVGKPVLKDVLQGYNGAILAYGQTGAGKTHSLLNPGKVPTEAGLLPRLVAALFVNIGSDLNHVYEVTVGCFQLYNEQVDDLLAEDRKAGSNLKIAPGGEVQGLTWVPAKTPADLIKAFQDGRNNIVYAETKMNKASSRSHAIFQIKVSKRPRADKNTGKTVKMKATFGKLTVVDLAGSERVKRSGVEGAQLKEAANINTSLLAFGNVVQALADKKKFVPFRDSKLTRILEDSMGGNCKTSLLVCLSPSVESSSETVSTLEFGSRAMRVEITATVNEGSVTVDAAKLAADLAGDDISDAMKEQAKKQRELEAAMEKKAKEAAKELEAAKKAADKNAATASKMEKEHEAMLQKWKAKAEDAAKKGEDSVKELKAKVAKLEAEVTEAKANKEAQAKVEEMEKKVKVLEESLAAAKAATKLQRDEREKEKERAAQSEGTKVSALAAEVAELQEKWQREAEARAELEQRLGQVTSRATQAEAERAKLVEAHAAEAAKVVEEHRRHVADLESTHQRAVQELVDLHSATSEEASRRHLAEVESECAALGRRHDAAMEQLRDVNFAEMEEARAEWNRQKQEAAEESRRQVAAAEQRGAEAKDGLETEKNAQIAALEAEGRDKERSIARLEEQARGLEAHLADRTSRLEAEAAEAREAVAEGRVEAERALAAARSEAAAMQAAAAEDHSAQLREAEERHQQELHRFENGADTVQRRTNMAFSAARSVLNLKLEVINAQMADLQARFDARESRADDVAQIAKLQANVRKAEADHRQQSAYATQLKLQLANRDENDKVFGGAAKAAEPGAGSFRGGSKVAQPLAPLRNSPTSPRKVRPLSGTHSGLQSLGAGDWANPF